MTEQFLTRIDRFLDAFEKYLELWERSEDRKQAYADKMDKKKTVRPVTDEEIKSIFGRDN